ncbi:MAG TPA: L,D-transpeptidase [Acidimicrobiales bacterium]|nr:L,D-transpeptidase [Acidimicrobiales bacterium]
MQGKFGRLVAVALIMTAVLAGCVASTDGQRQVASIGPAVDHAAPTSLAVPTTTTTPPPPPPTGAATGTRVGAARVNRAPVAAAPRPSGSPWAHYDGQLTNGNYIVAQAIGRALAVSVAPNAAPAVSLTNPLKSGAPRVVLVVADGGDWLQVLLPLRPNDSLGWVRRSDVTISAVHYRVEIDRAAHRLHVFDGDALVMDEPAAVGKPATPTPSGQFFAVELLQPYNPRGDYGPYAFTLSAYSNVYQSFGSGDGAVGMHGTNEPASVGRDASHGCVRLPNDAITRLAGMLPLGTPVFIR